MEEKHREILEELLYQISVDVYSILDEEYESVVDAIIALAARIEQLSDDIYEDEIVYRRSGKEDFKFNLQ